jgi:hypothetical protein
LLVLALKVIFIFMNAALDYRIEGEKSGHIELILKGSVMSLIIIVINCLMRLVVLMSLCRFKFLRLPKSIIVIRRNKLRFVYTTPSSILLMRVVWSTWSMEAQRMILLNYY